MKTHDEIIDLLKDAILEIKDIDESALTAESAIGDLGLDSLDFVEIQVVVKRAVGVQVDPKVFIENRVRTLGDFANYLMTEPVQ